MFILNNLRKESKDGWTYLKCNFDVTEIENPFKEKTIWIAVEDKNSDMLADNVYDAFILVPLYLAMYYKQDLHIKGNISPRLYHNIKHYLMKILDNFSKYIQPINFTVDGFDTVQITEVNKRLIGTGISCGVDSFTTIYDNFIKEKQEDYKINSLFFVNSGTHGHYEDKKTKKLWLDRAKLNKRAADELGLPMYLVDSNLHAYTYPIDRSNQKIGYLSIYSCIIALQKYIKRYLIASGSSYDDGSKYSLMERDVDMAAYSETYMPHLISTEIFELVIDGCQYTRSEKVERISDWDIVRKYLNVCVHPIEDGKNCSCCSKCMRTLMVLENIGKLHKFNEIFDIKTYHKNKLIYKYHFLSMRKKERQSASLIQYLKSHKYKLPSEILINTKYFIARALRKIYRELKQGGKNV